MNARALLVLIDDRDAAEAVAAAVGARRGIGGDDIVVVVAPDEFRGQGLWTNPGAPGWWTAAGLDACDTVVLTADMPALAAALQGVVTPWYVWCRDHDAAHAFARSAAVTAIVGEAPGSFADEACADLERRGWCFAAQPAWGPFRRMPAPVETVASANGHPAIVPATWQPAPPAEDRGGAAPPLPALRWSPAPVAAVANNATAPAPESSAVTAPLPEDREERLVDLGDLPMLSIPVAAAPPRRGIVERLGALLGGNGRAEPVDVAALSQALVAAHDTVVLVGSRKGGVGKTTESLAIGFLAAQAVEVHGGSALVIDANLTNADITVKLQLPAGTPTVRDVVTAIAAHQLPPTPMAVRGSTLRVLGEDRETQRYSRLEVEALAEHARARYTVTVVDLPNAIPGVEDKAEAAVDAWLPHADVVVIPVDTSIASFEGAADMLAAITDLRERSGDTYNPGVVIAFLRPNDIDPRRVAPDLAATLDELTEHGAHVVDIPASSRMGMVDWTDHPTPLVDADPVVTRAYWSLLAAVADARRTPA